MFGTILFFVCLLSFIWIGTKILVWLIGMNDRQLRRTGWLFAAGVLVCLVLVIRYA
jgi:Kef-type K+ transport system membrane component KefB